VASLLDKTTETDNAKRERWVAEMAGRFDVGLDAKVGERLVTFSKRLLGPTGFTWRAFFTDLLRGRDRIATWSSTAFGAEEDFGYGMIRDKTLPENWYVHESRTIGSRLVPGVWNLQAQWGAATTDALTPVSARGATPAQ
jgi:hypothetical protein